jgi:DnaJ-class molecular chaperone
LLLQPNAEAQFLEVKNAFTVLSDAKQKAEYDRKLRGVSQVLSGVVFALGLHQAAQCKVVSVDVQ